MRCGWCRRDLVHSVLMLTVCWYHQPNPHQLGVYRAFTASFLGKYNSFLSSSQDHLRVSLSNMVAIRYKAAMYTYCSTVQLWYLVRNIRQLYWDTKKIWLWNPESWLYGSDVSLQCPFSCKLPYPFTCPCLCLSSCPHPCPCPCLCSFSLLCTFSFNYLSIRSIIDHRPSFDYCLIIVSYFDTGNVFQIWSHYQQPPMWQ